MFFKIDILKNFVNFTAKHLCWSLFLIKLQALRLLRPLRDSNAVFSSETSKIFNNNFFLQNTSNGYFCVCFWCILPVVKNAVWRINLYEECKPSIYFFPINCCLQVFWKEVFQKFFRKLPEIQKTLFRRTSWYSCSEYF